MGNSIVFQRLRLKFEPPMRAIFAAILLALICGCGRPQTRVETGDRAQILHRGNGTEPQDVDPQTVTGVPEDHIIVALFEGLVAEDPHDLHPVAEGVAERWEISPDQKTYTFYLRPNARWSNGERVTARDFVRSYQRMLMPSLAAEDAYMLYVMKTAEDYNRSEEHTSELQSRFGISHAVFCLT